jgi:hypothetical protein
MEKRFIALSFDGHTQIWKCFDERTKSIIGIEEREGSDIRFYPMKSTTFPPVIRSSSPSVVGTPVASSPAAG